MIESQIEGPVSAWAEEEGYLVRKLQYPGRRGAPDRMFARKPKGPIFIEFKKPGDKEKRSTLQAREGDRLLEAGCNYFYVDNIQDACDILGIKNRNATTAHSPKAKVRRRQV